MPPEYSRTITVNQNLEKINYVSAVINLFKVQLKVLGDYEISYQVFSPYYSGHEEGWERESTEEYLIKKAGQEAALLQVHRNSTDFNFPTEKFPSGIADEEITISAQLKAERDLSLEKILRVMFERLDILVSP